MQYFNTREKTKVIVNICNLNLMNIAGRDSVVVLHSHWSSSYITSLSLVESFIVLKYFHALKGPIIGTLSDATSAILCHKEPARRKNEPYFLLLAGSLCQG